jgi:hypothetical protein
MLPRLVKTVCVDFPIVLTLWSLFSGAPVPGDAPGCSDDGAFTLSFTRSFGTEPSAPPPLLVPAPPAPPFSSNLPPCFLFWSFFPLFFCLLSSSESLSSSDSLSSMAVVLRSRSFRTNSTTQSDRQCGATLMSSCTHSASRLAEASCLHTYPLPDPSLGREPSRSDHELASGTLGTRNAKPLVGHRWYRCAYALGHGERGEPCQTGHEQRSCNELDPLCSVSC